MAVEEAALNRAHEYAHQCQEEHKKLEGYKQLLVSRAERNAI